MTLPILKQYSLIATQQITPPSSLGGRLRTTALLTSSTLVGGVESPEVRSGIGEPGTFKVGITTSLLLPLDLGFSDDFLG